MTDFPPSDGWVLSYAFASLTSTTQTPLAWDAAYVTDDDVTFTVTIPATITAPLSAGAWKYQEIYTNGTEIHRFTGLVTLLANVSTATAGSLVTYAERMLPIVEAEIAARISGDGSAHEGYSVGGRSISKMDIDSLRALRGSLLAEIAAQRGNGKFGRDLVTVFRQPSGSVRSGSDPWQ